MKKTLFFLLCYPFASFCQSQDTSCVESRWLILDQNESNDMIFLNDSKHDGSLDLVKIIHRLVQDGALNIYQQDLNAVDGNFWVNIDYKKELKLAMADTTSYFPAKDPYFELIRISDVPLTNDYGDPLIRTNEAGVQEYVYPPIEPFVFSTKECKNVRVLEQILYDEELQTYDTKAVGVGFYMQYLDRPGELKFWVKLDELFEALNDKDKYPWYQALVKRTYRGRSYLHKYCDEE